MPSTTEDHLVEAIAGLDAAHTVFAAFAGGTDTPLSTFFLERAWDLKQDALGPNPEEDADFDSDPLIVRIEARSCEIAADALDTLGLDELASRYRGSAARMREAGTVDVYTAA